MFRSHGFENIHKPPVPYITIRGRWANDGQLPTKPSKEDDLQITFDKLVITPRNTEWSSIRRAAGGSTLRLNFGRAQDVIDTFVNPQVHMRVPAAGALSYNRQKKQHKKQQRAMQAESASATDNVGCNDLPIIEENAVFEGLVSTRSVQRAAWEVPLVAVAEPRASEHPMKRASENDCPAQEVSAAREHQCSLEALDLATPWKPKQVKYATDCWGHALCAVRSEGASVQEWKDEAGRADCRAGKGSHPDYEVLEYVQQNILREGHSMNVGTKKHVLASNRLASGVGASDGISADEASRSCTEPSAVGPELRADVQSLIEGLQEWLVEHNLRLTAASGVNNNCLIKAVLQAVKGDYRTDNHEESDMIRDKIGAERGSMLTIDIHGTRLLKVLSEDFDSKLHALFEVMPCQDGTAVVPMITTGVVDEAVELDADCLCIFVIQTGDRFQGFAIGEGVLEGMSTMSADAHSIPSHTSSSESSASSTGDTVFRPECASLSKCGVLQTREMPSLGTVGHGVQCVPCRPHLRGDCPAGEKCLKCHAPHSKADVQHSGQRSRQKKRRFQEELRRYRSPERCQGLHRSL